MSEPTPPEVPARAPVVEAPEAMTPAEFIVAEQCPAWQLRLFARATAPLPTTRAGLAKLLARLLAERI